MVQMSWIMIIRWDNLYELAKFTTNELMFMWLLKAPIILDVCLYLWGTKRERNNFKISSNTPAADFIWHSILCSWLFFIFLVDATRFIYNTEWANIHSYTYFIVCNILLIYNGEIYQQSMILNKCEKFTIWIGIKKG